MSYTYSVLLCEYLTNYLISRIQTAQGNPPTAPGLQVDHLRDKVLKNAPKEASNLLNQVKQLATQLN